jgi:hypothetical protein
MRAMAVRRIEVDYRRRTRIGAVRGDAVSERGNYRACVGDVSGRAVMLSGRPSEIFSADGG